MKNRLSNSRLSRPSRAVGRDVQWCMVLIVVALSAGGCGPDQGEVRAEMTEAGPLRPRTEGQYEKEPPPPPPAPVVDPCDDLASAIRREFPRLYRIAESPRFAVIANISSGDVADATDAGSARRKENTSALGRRPVYDHKEHVLILNRAASLEEALPIDRSAVENLFIEFLSSLAPDTKIIDPGVVREILRRGADGKPPSVSQDICEVCIVLDVHVARENPISGDRMIALTARAIRMSDGAILSVSTPRRCTAVGERNVDEVLRRICFCSGVYLIDRVVKRWQSEYAP